MIIGPSHVIRMSHFNFYLNVTHEFYGIGGLPIWHHSIKKYVCGSILDKSSAFILVGDFRFGNGYDYTGLESDIFRVERKYISGKDDERMYAKSIKALDELTDIGGNYIFWCLFAREYKNKKKDKYFFDGVYKHPAWHLEKVEKRYSKSCVPLAGLLDYNLDFFFIDSSNHPSLYGFLFLKYVVEGTAPEVAYCILLRLRKKISALLEKKMLLVDKVIVSGVNSSFRLFKETVYNGFFDASFTRCFGIREADEALFSADKFFNSLIFFGTEDSLNSEASNNFLFKANYELKVLITLSDYCAKVYRSVDGGQFKLLNELVLHGADKEIVGGNANFLGFLKILTAAVFALNVDAEYAENVINDLIEDF